MKTLLEPLNHDELAILDQFLLGRVAEEDEDEEDPGLLSISELDGLFTAIVSGPVLVAPEQWMPVVWGAHEPEWESEDQFEAYIGLMMRHMNTIAATLDEAPEEFEPLFLQDEEDGEAFLIVDDWCEGYVQGVGLATAQWRTGGSSMERMLSPIRAFSSATDWLAHEMTDEKAIEQLSDTIAPNVRSIHKFWSQRRKPGGSDKSSPWDNARK